MTKNLSKIYLLFFLLSYFLLGIILIQIDSLYEASLLLNHPYLQYTYISRIVLKGLTYSSLSISQLLKMIIDHITIIELFVIIIMIWYFDLKRHKKYILIAISELLCFIFVIIIAYFNLGNVVLITYLIKSLGFILVVYALLYALIILKSRHHSCNFRKNHYNNGESEE